VERTVIMAVVGGTFSIVTTIGLIGWLLDERGDERMKGLYL